MADPYVPFKAWNTVSSVYQTVYDGWNYLEIHFIECNHSFMIPNHTSRNFRDEPTEKAVEFLKNQDNPVYMPCPICYLNIMCERKE